MISIAKPLLGKKEIRAVSEVLESGMLSQGEKVAEFEKNFSSYIGTSEGVAISNGTVALDLSLKTLDLKPGDEVITTPFSFIATSNAILFQGAKPVFSDIEESTLNIDPDSVNKKITRRTKGIIAVHLYGQPCRIEELRKICDDNEIFLIEDCAQAHGAEYNKKKVGTFGDLSCFSFYATKNMTTGEGGMITTNNTFLANKLRMLRDHGQDEKYAHSQLGYNFRMTEIAAAIGIEQLKKLEEFNEKRIENAKHLTENLSSIKNILLPKVPKNTKCVFHQYAIRTKDRDELAQHLKENNIGTSIHYPSPIYAQPLYVNLGYKQGISKIAERVSKEILSLPVHAALTQNELDEICSAIKSYF